MTVSEQALTSLAAASDIISLGMLADDMRRQRHGLTTTFVRVVEVAADPGASIQIAAAAGEVRIAGTPATRGAALQRARDVVAAAAGTPVSAFALEDLEELAGREGVTLRALLEDVRKAGVELIAQASFDRLHDARSAIE